MKQSLAFLMPMLALGLFSAQHADAATRLVKSASQSDVYVAFSYPDGTPSTRLAFPNEKVYRSWFADFSNVETISGAELARYQLSGLVYYRPGSRMVKITTDPKVYFVDNMGALRWVETEEAARELYGASWAQKIDDVPDIFFPQYHVNAAQSISYNVAVALRATLPTSGYNSLEALGGNQLPPSTPTNPLPPPPQTTSTTPIPTEPEPTMPTSTQYTAVLETTVAQPRLNEPFTLTGTASPQSGLTSVRIFLDGNLEKSCFGTNCTITLTLPSANARDSYTARIEARWDNGAVASSELTLPRGTGSPYVYVEIPHTTVEPNSYREVIARAQNGYIAKYIDIYMDGNLVRGCIDIQECRYSEQETSAIGTTHEIVAVVSNASGAREYSSTSTIAVVLNDSPTVTVEPDTASLYTGETTTVTVRGEDNDGVAQTTISVNGEVVKTCQTPLCSITVGPWDTAQTIRLDATATDIPGAQSVATQKTITIRAR